MARAIHRRNTNMLCLRRSSYGLEVRRPDPDPLRSAADHLFDVVADVGRARRINLAAAPFGDQLCCGALRPPRASIPGPARICSRTPFPLIEGGRGCSVTCRLPHPIGDFACDDPHSTLHQHSSAWNWGKT